MVLDDKTREQTALFRYGLIADLVHRREAEKGLYPLLREKAERVYEIPGSRRTRVAAETIRDWLSAYRRGGFEALRPQVRRDQGRARAIPQPIADLLCQIKDETPALSVNSVIEQVRAAGVGDEHYLAPATVHRLLSRHGLMDRRLQEPTSKDRRRFAFDKAGELWMSDVMHGPAVTIEGGRKRKSYLIGLLDDATRVVPYAAFALSENTAAFLPVLQQAVLRRGVPKRLYVDSVASHRIHVLCPPPFRVERCETLGLLPPGKRSTAQNAVASSASTSSAYLTSRGDNGATRLLRPSDDDRAHTSVVGRTRH